MPVERHAVYWAAVLASVAKLVSAEEVERASSEAVGIAATLIGAVSFQMGLFHMTNHRDPDMRKYTYAVINETASIFCSVLMFQTCNDIVEYRVLDGLTMEQKFLVNLLHMLFWFVVLQISLAFVTGVIGPPPKNVEHMEHRTKCYATLLAHVTGFASINAWGSLQQLDYFKTSAWMSFAVLPISIIGQFLLQRLTDSVRWRVAMLDGEESEYEKMWDFETEEAENDVMGLTLSFNLIQAIRFAISGVLPNQEGVEPMPVLVSHSGLQIGTLWLLALGFALLVFFLVYMAPSEEEEEEKSSCGEAVDAESGEEKKESKPCMDELKERVWEIMMLACSMGTAWCCFYSGKMSLAQIGALQDSMILAIALTLVISLVSFSMIRILDIIADDERTGDRVKVAIKQVIRSLALLVGFGWEQAFDQAVESLSSVMLWPHLGKFLLAIFCIIVIVPAWYEYILPMAITKNWEWGFLVKDFDDPSEEEKWLKVVEHIKEKRARANTTASAVQSDPSEAPPIPAGYMSQLTASLDDVANTLRKARKESEFQAEAPYVQLAGDENTVIQELQKQNLRLRKALAESVDALRAREQAEQQRALDLKVDIRQMDTMLMRMKEVEGMVTNSMPQSARR